MRRSLYVSGFLFVAIAASWVAVAQQPTAAQNVNQQQLQAWEYRELEMHGGGFDRASANKFGENGWELVATFTPTNRNAVSVLIFKRQK